MIKLRPTRTLNERAFFMGLDFNDIIALSLSFFIVQALLSGVVPKIVPIFILALMFLVLSVIRLKFRRKILRDLIGYLLRKRNKYVQ